MGAKRFLRTDQALVKTFGPIAMNHNFPGLRAFLANYSRTKL